MGRCEDCGHRFILPIPDRDRLLDWGKSAPFYRLQRFMRHGGACGHPVKVVDELIRIYERRLGIEFEVSAYKRAQAAPPLTNRAKARFASFFHPHGIIVSLRSLDPAQFELWTARLFQAWGYDAQAVGRGGDGGIDVRVQLDGRRHAIAQCKRYKTKKVGPHYILQLVGAREAVGVKYAYFFTTSKFTKSAKRTAAEFDWMFLYNGQRMADAIRNLIADRPTAGAAMNASRATTTSSSA